MGYVKLIKNSNYYKRYQVKMRRRRQCKTDYQQRRGLITQDKRKYNAPKWRFIVRRTNQDVICQVASAKLIGDHILCAAYSRELKRFGLPVGLTNYSAHYCTGLLLARRLLKKLKLDKIYPGKRRLDGNLFKSDVRNVRWKAGQKIYRPFKCLLDVGLARTTSGARIFGALKGAVDGGLNIPHRPNRFPGFKKGQNGAKDEYKADKHADKIFGGHVKKYMEHLQEKDAERYARHFSRFIAAGIGPDDLKPMYEKVHRAIRQNPARPPKKVKDYKNMPPLRPRMKKMTLEQRKDRRLQYIARLEKQGQEKQDNEIEIDQDGE